MENDVIAGLALLFIAAVLLVALLVRIRHARRVLGPGHPFPYLWHCTDCRRWGGAKDVLDRESALHRHQAESGHWVLRGAPTDGRDQ